MGMVHAVDARPGPENGGNWIEHGLWIKYSGGGPGLETGNCGMESGDAERGVEAAVGTGVWGRRCGEGRVGGGVGAGPGESDWGTYGLQRGVGVSDRD